MYEFSINVAVYVDKRYKIDSTFYLAVPLTVNFDNNSNLDDDSNKTLI